MSYWSQQTWGSGSCGVGGVSASNHFFSGQNVFVFLYSYEQKKLVPLPCTSFGYAISQQKVPIYGAWSYTFDAIAKGQKIVQGEFSVVYGSPNMLSNMIGSGETSDYYPSRDTDGSLQPLGNRQESLEVAQKRDLREKYWSQSGDNSYLDLGLQKNRNDMNEAYPFGRQPKSGEPKADYAGHQPFDIIIVYGDNPSMRFTDNSKFDYATWEYTANEYMRMMSTTPNESSAGWESSYRKRIVNVELTGASSVLEISGQPLQQTFGFIARDITTPNVIY